MTPAIDVFSSSPTLFKLTDSTLKVSGPDSQKLLQGLLSNELRKLNPTNAIAACHLTPKGKLLAVFTLFLKDNSNTIWLKTSASEAEIFKQATKAQVLLSESVFEDVSDHFLWFLFTGDLAASFMYQKIGFKIDAEFNHLVFKTIDFEIDVLKDPRWRVPAFLIGCLKRESPTFLEWLKHEMDFKMGDAENLEQLRIESKIPIYPKEFDQNCLPPEVGFEDEYISYTKGCYVGQEVISRLKHYGKAKRMLVQLLFSEVIDPNQNSGPWAIFADQKEIGKMTSVVYSDFFKNWMGLAIVDRAAIESNQKLTLKILDHEIPLSEPAKFIPIPSLPDKKFF